MTLSVTQPVITCSAAGELVAAAMEEARRQGLNIAVAVLDPAGHMVAAARMDGVPPPVLDYATDKAFTATLGKSSLAFGERMASAPDLTIGAANRPRVCGWEGGLPVREGEALIGAIGVSGATGPEDATCATAALKALGLKA